LAALPDWKLLVVGGENTAANWTLSGAEYLSFDEQTRLGFNILAHTPNDNLRCLLDCGFSCET
jgi:hypothetical protein